MSKYPSLSYSMNAVRRAGNQLSGKLTLEDYSREELIDIFNTAHSWRDSHIYPMRSIRQSIQSKIRAGKFGGIMAARPKRISSIRRKLSTTTIKLDQMNDIGGCRAIMHDIAGVNDLLDRIYDQFPHEIRQEWPYIQNPKDDGYRSHHVVFKFNPRDMWREEYRGRRIELQIRTRLQHSWATTVEAVSLFRGEDLKHHQGDEDWLRLFLLASSEFSYVENCNEPNGVPSHEYRVKEIRDLNHKLGAVSILENIKNATHYAENYLQTSGRYYLIKYFPDHMVTVSRYGNVNIGANKLAEVERKAEIDNDGVKAVLVEVDKVEKLVETYPNYFGDVSLFVSNLRKICEGRRAVEYTMAPQQVVAPKPREMPSMDLLHRRYSVWEEKRNSSRKKPIR